MAKDPKRSRSAQRAGRKRAPDELDLVAERSAFARLTPEIEADLASGRNAGLLEDYFGTAAYQELSRLTQASRIRAARGPRVLILPGILGSKLGDRRVVWINPLTVPFGVLRRLSLSDGDPNIRALGSVIELAYLNLKMALIGVGYDADFHAYDWRQSLDGLGRAFAERLRKESADGEVHVIAHSMGGLVLRAALNHDVGRLGRRILLGVPHFGSFSPVTAFRGVHPLLRRLDSLDPHNSGDEFARKVFGTFPGLVEMLPSPAKYPQDFFAPASWPQGGNRPADAMLVAGRKVHEDLADDVGDDAVAVVGVRRETIVSADIVADEFRYGTSLDGDGTVPLLSAMLPAVKRTYFVEADHGALANNRHVVNAIKDILASGETDVLDKTYERSRAIGRAVAEADLRRATTLRAGDGAGALSIGEQRSIIAEFAAPPDVGEAGVVMSRDSRPTEVGSPRIDLRRRIVVGRRRLYPLDLTVALGSITEADSSTMVLGLFRQVEPGGAARAVDAAMGGAISELMSRRMFNANVGEVTVLPTGRHPLRADAVVFAGLGSFDSFREQVLEVVGENVVRTLVATQVDDFATVPIGAGSGLASFTALGHLMRGFVRGLRDSDPGHRFRAITVCETDPERFEALKSEFHRLSASELFDEMEVTLTETVLPVRAETVIRGAPGAPPPPAGSQSVYLMVRQEPGMSDDRVALGASVLTAGARATVVKGRSEFAADDLEALLDKITSQRFNLAGLEALGKRLAAMTLPQNVRDLVARYRTNPLVVVHDAVASRVPWETIFLDDYFPALEGGLTHSYEAEDLSVAKWLEQQQLGPTLDLLLVANPTNDLAAAEIEGDQIEELFSGLGRSATIEVLRGDAATRDVLMRKFGSGDYDVVHYAGHAFFDPVNPANSGIVCAFREVLSGADLAGVGRLPSLVFFNACEAARIRKAGEAPASRLAIPERVRRNIGFAEAFLRGGVANFLGTYWPVGDEAAQGFAKIFYEEVLRGATIGEAIKGGRAKLRGGRSIDWADYVHYGDPAFVLKRQPDRG